MNKILIKIGILFLTIILTSCTYSPIFSEKNYNFEIEYINLDGEKDINKNIVSELNLIQNNQDEKKKKFNLKIYTKKQRNIISKDGKGDPLKFEMTILVKYEIASSGKVLLEKELEKKNIYNNDSDQFKLEQSEKIIIENMSDNISNIINSSIMNLNDN